MKQHLSDHFLQNSYRGTEYIQCVLRVQPTRCDFSQLIYFYKTLYMFQTVLPSITRSSKLHIQRQAFVVRLLLPAASLDEMELQLIPFKLAVIV